MRELELLLQNFQLTVPPEGGKRSGKGKKSQQASSDKSLSPSAVLETLRHTLTDYQHRLDHTTQEVKYVGNKLERVLIKPICLLELGYHTYPSLFHLPPFP